MLGCLALVATLFVNTSCNLAPSASESRADPALRDPEKNSALKPVPRDAGWVKRHEGFVADSKRGGIDVLFLGDSITDFWRSESSEKGGRPVWNREFAPLHAANFGISGDRTQHVLWRLDHGEVDGIDPKVVVLMIGTNNIGLERDKVTRRNTPEQALEGVNAVVRSIREKLPHAKLLLLGVFPRGEKPDDPLRAEIGIINRSISRLADNQTIRYLDLTPKFLAADGTLPKEIMPDFLHPSQKGYEIWAREIKPLLLQMLR